MVLLQFNVETKIMIMQPIQANRRSSSHVHETLPALEDPFRNQVLLLLELERWCDITNLHHTSGLSTAVIYALLCGDRCGGSD